MRKPRSFLTFFFVVLLILFLSPGQGTLSVMKAEGALGETLSEYQKKTEQGDPDAQLNLGHMYILGENFPQNSAEAASWLRKAADLGNLNAQFIIVNLYNVG